MADSAAGGAAAAKPSSSVKLVLLGEAAVGKVECLIRRSSSDAIDCPWLTEILSTSQWLQMSLVFSVAVSS